MKLVVMFMIVGVLVVNIIVLFVGVCEKYGFSLLLDSVSVELVKVMF